MRPITVAGATHEERTVDVPHDFVYIENASATAICDVVVAVSNASEELTASGMANAFTNFVSVIPPGRYRLEDPLELQGDQVAQRRAHLP